MDDDAIEQAISAVVRARFDGQAIDSVSVTPGVDSDGDPVLRVIVVFPDEASLPEVRKMLGLVRHIREAAGTASESRFPLVSYRRKSDPASVFEPA